MLKGSTRTSEPTHETEELLLEMSSAPQHPPFSCCYSPRTSFHLRPTTEEEKAAHTGARHQFPTAQHKQLSRFWVTEAHPLAPLPVVRQTITPRTARETLKEHLALCP